MSIRIVLVRINAISSYLVGGEYYRGGKKDQRIPYRITLVYVVLAVGAGAVKKHNNTDGKVVVLFLVNMFKHFVPSLLLFSMKGAREFCPIMPI